jgi:hypothetical protein
LLAACGGSDDSEDSLCNSSLPCSISTDVN